MAIDIPGPWYYFWLIPSIISGSMTLLMILHISYSWKTDQNLLHFQKICLFFGFFDIIQDIGLILDLWRGFCRVQYTLFLSGSLYKAFIATGGLGGLYVMIIHNIHPSDIVLIKWAFLWLLLATVVLLILFVSDEYHDLGCSENARENLIAVDNVSLKSQLVFGLTFCLFTLLCCLLVTYMSLRILYRFKSYTHFYTFRTTVFLYIFIFLFAIVPGCIYLLNLAISHEYHDTILEITGLSLCSSGWLFSLTYFFLNFSPKIQKFLLKMTRFYDNDNGYGNQHSELPLSSQSSPAETISAAPGPPSSQSGKKKLHSKASTLLTQTILSRYHDESHWIESGTDPYGLSYPESHSSADITHHDHVTNPVAPYTPSAGPRSDEPEAEGTGHEGNESFHNKLISSLYDIRMESPQDG
jgi:hypothetical protein